MASGVVTGVDICMKALEKTKDELTKRIADGMLQCAEIVLAKSQIYVPKDKGNLAKSGEVIVTGTGKAAEAIVAYGGPDAPYALYVHEDLTKSHKAPTCAKFLEKAYRESRGTMIAAIKRNIEASRGVTKTPGGRKGKTANAQKKGKGNKYRRNEGKIADTKKGKSVPRNQRKAGKKK